MTRWNGSSKLQYNTSKGGKVPRDFTYIPFSNILPASVWKSDQIENWLQFSPFFRQSSARFCILSLNEGRYKKSARTKTGAASKLV